MLSFVGVHQWPRLSQGSRVAETEEPANTAGYRMFSQSVGLRELICRDEDNYVPYGCSERWDGERSV